MTEQEQGRERDVQRRRRLVEVFRALERRDELLAILHSSSSRADAVDRIEQELGTSVDAASMLLELRLERLLPQYELQLRAEILAIDGE